MTRAERDQLRRAIDAAARARLEPLGHGAELDREPRHESCSLHHEVRVVRPAWSRCAEDETFVPSTFALYGARLAVVGTGVLAPPCPSRIYGVAA